MFDKIPDEEIKRIKCPISMGKYGWHDALQMVAESQKSHTLKQVYDWGREACPHAGYIGQNWEKRECLDCWQELQKEATK